MPQSPGSHKLSIWRCIVLHRCSALSGLRYLVLHRRCQRVSLHGISMCSVLLTDTTEGLRPFIHGSSSDSDSSAMRLTGMPRCCGVILSTTFEEELEVFENGVHGFSDFLRRSASSSFSRPVSVDLRLAHSSHLFLRFRSPLLTYG